MEDCIVIGCGFAGSVIARHLAEKNKKVLIIERRNHIAGNMYDFRDENGILVQKYGPHTFHTTNKKLYDYINRFAEWVPFELKCMTYIDGKFTPTPFNFQTIDDYYTFEEAYLLKKRIKEYYNGQDKTTIVEMLDCEDETIRSYAQFLYDKDYSLYTAKQWGISPKDIDISVLKRVPVRLSYKNGYFDDEYQVMPKISFVNFFENILSHPNIEIRLNTEAKDVLEINTNSKFVKFDGKQVDIPVIYTGALDQLLDYKYGELPYRSLRFEYHTINMTSYQEAPVVAYPQEKEFTRITEYTKLPVQMKNITKIAIEYPLQHNLAEKTEPYYPILTDNSIGEFGKYRADLSDIENLFLCGRLADFKYYNMDQILEKAMAMCDIIDEWLGGH
ncbi:MAG TPA: UDP-galactopyranose mutase [Clostridiales bacterium]|nr:UDP-galactopyranose mutase [Clostridiales bacterium]